MAASCTGRLVHVRAGMGGREAKGHLTADASEVAALRNMLNGCPTAT